MEEIAMSITIDLPNEVFWRLEKQAKARGTTAAETIARLIEDSERLENQAFSQLAEGMKKIRLSTVIKQMRAEGLFAAAPDQSPARPVDLQPIQVQGKPLSEVIIEERR
jgi:predicted transcriptional regulator